MQKFVAGRMYDLNSAPDWLLKESAENLGNIHTALKNYTDLPIGIGEDFFKNMMPQNAERSYLKSLETARNNGDTDIEQELLYRIELMKHFPKYEFDLSKLTCQASHGDYFISQLICGESCINATIDWTSACVHPVIWEIIRSYVYAAHECVDGVIDDERFSQYVDDYLKYASLTDYDMECIP